MTDEEKLARLKKDVANATTEYIIYNKSVWYSFFHRHGTAGRTRAFEFNRQFSLINNYKEAVTELLAYLKDSQKGNSHPHSYRTMLLNEVLPGSNETKPSLQELSNNFTVWLKKLKNLFGDIHLSVLGRNPMINK